MLPLAPRHFRRRHYFSFIIAAAAAMPLRQRHVTPYGHAADATLIRQARQFSLSPMRLLPWR